MPRHVPTVRRQDSPAPDPAALLAQSHRLWAAYREHRDPALLRRIAALDALIPPSLADEEGGAP